MDLYATDMHFVLVNGSHCLWINRQTGTYTTDETNRTFKTEGLPNLDNVRLGLVYGYVGKFRVSINAEPRLIFVQKRSVVGCIKNHEIYKIVSVVSIPLESESEVMLEPCINSPLSKKKVHHETAVPSTSTGTGGSPNESSSPKQLVKVKCPASRPRGSGPKKLEKLEKVERRVLDNFHMMFTEADSFYYSTEYDITNTVQRSVKISEDPIKSQAPLWQRVDTRFFWNHYMMKELFTSKGADIDRWIIPIMQGFIQLQSCHIEHIFDNIGPDRQDTTIRGQIDLAVISRRSRFRAGTRYLRRGVDEHGKVANYVETEQIVVFKGHMISFVQTRGSIPVFWSQPGFRYRPPPRLERQGIENYDAFTRHLNEERQLYGPLVLVNLVEKIGKEKVLGDAYLENVLRRDDPELAYIIFDFHENCRGMRFENVSLLIDNMETPLKNMNYCWVDSYGTVLSQSGVCRVNCIDCLDRTNVVQTHLAKHMLCAQLRKLGLVAPEFGLPDNVKMTLQTMWANNGDTISKQYAGTNALKGDYTRTGERKLAGVMKDGMNSANRYYMNRFKDASRLAVTELMLGIRNNITEADFASDKAHEENENTVEQIKMVIDDVKKCVIPSNDVVLGSWGLINGRTNEPDSMDIDTIFVLAERRYYVTEYDCSMDSITETQKVGLLSIESIELGFEPLAQPSHFFRLFHQYHHAPATAVPHLRLHYRSSGEIQYHEFRSSNIRFYNNKAAPIRYPAEMLDALKLIAEAVRKAVNAQGKTIQVLLTALPFKEPAGIPAIASSLVNRYFYSSSQTNEQGIQETDQPRKLIALDRFTPKYFRRTTNTVSNKVSPTYPLKHHQVLSEESAFQKEENVADDKKSAPMVLAGSPIQLQTSQPFGMECQYNYEMSINASTPVEGHSSSITIPVKDLVLPSCGIIVLPQRRPISSLLMSSASELMLDIDDGGREKDILSNSPVTPVSEYIPQSQEAPNSNYSNIASLIHSNSILQRHRHSLPTNSLGTGGICPYSVPGRSVTPEITITEEPAVDMTLVALDGSFVPKNLLSGSISVAKRMSRSSEDVNVMTNNTSVISLVGSNIGQGVGLRLRNLAPIIKNENRSTSDQDIFGSLVNMKGSHSESALRDNPYQQSGSQKKDLVLVPLGKLARGMQNLGASYLDPRKIRDTFKQPRGAEPVKRETPDSPILAERKKNSKTLIIEL